MTTTDIEWTPEKLDEPLRWRKPQRVFVNSMSDLFHEDVPFDFIDNVFAIMGAARQHVFQVLTKRPDRMQRYMTAPARCGYEERPRCWMIGSAMRGWPTERAGAEAGRTLRWHEEVSARGLALQSGAGWPLPNVWLGVSVEDQQRADERIPLLLSTPAAVRFLSCEPLLGPVNLPFVPGVPRMTSWPSVQLERPPPDGRLDWVIVGGESGPGARPCHVDWIRELVVQCRTASVPVFVKQLADKEGGDTSEWPSDLRVREFPEVRS